jgi:SAM-dependent methyltransferase
LNTSQAVALIAAAVPRTTKTWVDIGAGEGTFSRALIQLLGRDARVFAVDRDQRSLASLHRWAQREQVNVIPVEADFTHPLELPELVDGMLLANVLHFVRNPDVVLGGLVRLVRPGGRVIIGEYDRRAASRWVPHPIPFSELRDITDATGLTAPTIIATKPSAYGGTLYVAAADRLV